MAKPPKAEKKTVETKKPMTPTDVELAFNLNQNYTNLMQAQANISAINRELERRQAVQAKKPKE